MALRRSAEQTIEATGERQGKLVEVRDLSLDFQRNGETVHALRGVSLDVAPGEIVGLVGESGSGKSVLGLALLGLLPDRPRPDIRGSVTVCGTDMVRAGAEPRRLVRRNHLGAVFQDPMTSLNPTMRVGRQIAEAAGSEEEAARLLDAVGVPDAQRRLAAYPHELSGGLRQRVMIAMAVAGRPALVVADEPTTALDVTVQAQILELLASLREQLRTSFLLITHDLGVAAQVADRIGVLYCGRLAEIGPAQDMFRRPRHPYSVGLLRSRLLLDSDRSRPVITLPGEPPDPRRPPAGCAFGPRCSHHRRECDTSLPELIAAPELGSAQVACVRWADLPAAAEGPAVEEPAPEERAADQQIAADAQAADDQAAGEEATGAAPPWPVPDPAAPRPGTALVVRDVHKSFPVGSRRHREALRALRGVSLDIREGEAIALVGESGCGKSTLLRSVAGLQPIDSGIIDLARGGRPQMVFQDAGASLTPWLRVGELIGERLREEGLRAAPRKARVEASLQLVGLPAEIAAARPSQLSGGQRQRVALARATVVPPEVLLCDEPTSALDVSLAATVLNLIGRLRRELGMAVLFVTHDLAAARIVADRIAVMYLGRIVEVGDADQLTEDPVHPYTRALLATVPGLHQVRVPLQGEPASPLRPPAGCEFHPRCPDAEPACGTSEAPLVPLGADPGRLVACPVHLRSRG
jgi:peptide/nickel transport system ATP-binding protein